MIRRSVKTITAVKRGEPFAVERDGKSAEFVHHCCDCGLRHDVRVNIGPKNLVFRFWRLPKRK